jgi:nucleotide-binding universal stress UspA family protein
MRANRAYAQLLSKVDRTLGSATSVEVIVRRGKAREIIAATANELDADLIVLAAPKSRRLDSIVGTTAERLVRSAKRPVLVVRREVRGGYRNVAIAADLSTATTPMIRTALRLGALDRARATLVHAVHPSYDGVMRSAGLDESTIISYQSGSQADARRRLQKMAADAGLPILSTRVIVRNDSAAAAIRTVLEDERPELLTIGASRWFLLKRLLIGSVADRMLRAAQSDVLVIPYRPGVLAGVPARRDVAAVPNFVPIQSRLQQHDGGDRRAHAHE